MPESSFDRDVRDYYQAGELPAERKRALLDMIDAAPTPTRTPLRMNGSAWRFTLVTSAVAALLAITLTLGVVFLIERDGRAVFARGPTSIDEATDQPVLLGVRVYADWCKPSMEMAPLIEQLQRTYGDRGVLFVGLNITTKQTCEEAAAMARSLEAGWVYDEKGRVSGEFHLVDAKKHTVLTTFTSNDNLEDMTRALDAALSSG